MADGDRMAGGIGIGMIIGLLIVLLILVAGAYAIFGAHGNSAPSPGQAVSGAASSAGHTVSGTVKAK